MEHSRHVLRVLLLLVVVVSVVLLTRGFLVPKSYGDYGAYRADNVVEQANIRAPRHGGAASCAPCHAKQTDARNAGRHKTVNCEVCHAPVATHAVEKTVTAKMAVDRSVAMCSRCHGKVAGRPAKFPQVVLEEHVPVALEEGVCLQCHDPHSPKP